MVLIRFLGILIAMRDTDIRTRLQWQEAFLKEQDSRSEMFSSAETAKSFVFPKIKFRQTTEHVKGNILVKNLGRLVELCTNSERFITVKLYDIVWHLNTAPLGWIYLVLFQNSEYVDGIRRDVTPGPTYRAELRGERKILICLSEMQF
jgi:hypothetical protein